MRMLIPALTALAATSFLPHSATAADLDDYGYGERTVIRERVPVIQERIIERRYYEPPRVVGYYEERFRPLPYYAGYRDYGWDPGVRWDPDWRIEW